MDTRGAPLFAASLGALLAVLWLCAKELRGRCVPHARRLPFLLWAVNRTLLTSSAALVTLALDPRAEWALPPRVALALTDVVVAAGGLSLVAVVVSTLSSATHPIVTHTSAEQYRATLARTSRLGVIAAGSIVAARAARTLATLSSNQVRWTTWLELLYLLPSVSVWCVFFRTSQRLMAALNEIMHSDSSHVSAGGAEGHLKVRAFARKLRVLQVFGVASVGAGAYGRVRDFVEHYRDVEPWTSPLDPFFVVRAWQMVAFVLLVALVARNAAVVFARRSSRVQPDPAHRNSPHSLRPSQRSAGSSRTSPKGTTRSLPPLAVGVMLLPPTPPPLDAHNFHSVSVADSPTRARENDAGVSAAPKQGAEGDAK